MRSFLNKKNLLRFSQALLLFIFLTAGFSAKACSPLNVPILLNQSIVGQNLLLNWQSTTTWTGIACPDVIDVEIACMASPYSGSAAYTFTTPPLVLTSIPMNYPVQTINISALCPGVEYKFRARHRNSGGILASNWSSNFTFTVPGVYQAPAANIVPSQNVICPGQSASLTVYNSGCGIGFSTFSWTPATGLSCANCPTPVATPTVSTNYTLVIMGSQLACWTATATVSITVANPTVVVNSPSICPGETATITASGADNFFWSFGSFPNGPNTGGAAPLVTTVYTVTGNTAGCTASSQSTVFVYPVPNLVVNSPIACAGQPINLTATGAVTYSWQGPLGFNSNIQNPSIPNASATMSGAYTVTGTSAQGCTATAVSGVGVQSLPVPAIISNAPVCINSMLTFASSGANGYQWTGPDNFSAGGQYASIPSVSPLAAGVYTVVGSIGTCTASATTTVTLKSLPSPTIQSNSPVCAGKPLSLSGSGGITYSWLGPQAFLSYAQNSTVPNMSAIKAGTYTLAVTGTNNCTGSITTNVIVNPLPVISGSNILVCLGQALFLSANNGQTYYWEGPNFTSMLQNPLIPNVGYGQNGQYSVTVTSAAGCSIMAVSSVTVLSLPSPTIVSTSSICAASNLVLMGLGGTSYLWSGPNSFSGVGQIQAINAIPIANSGVYTLSASIGNCTGVTTKSITVMPLPTEVAANTGPACDTQTLQLTSGGAANCQWTGPDGFSSAISAPFFAGVTMSTSGVYTLIVTDANNCQAISLTSVVIYPNPIVSATGATVCSGQPAFIQSNGGIAYQWMGPDGFAASTANATISVVTPANAGTYTVVVSSVQSCTSVSGVHVAAMPIPNPSLIVTPRACVNSTVSLEAFGGVAYQWDGPADFISTEYHKVFMVTHIGQGGIYTLTALNAAGCPGFTTTNIIIDPLPDGVLVSENENRCVPFCDKFRLAAIGNTPITSTTWKIDGLIITADTFKYCLHQAGNHYLSGTFVDANGCINTNTFMIEALPVPVAGFVYHPEQPVESADQVVFTNTSEGENITRLTWSFLNNGGYKTNVYQPAYIFEDAGIYPVSLVVKNGWGCTDTVVRPVKIESDFIIYVPNAFTPNDDDDNETFQPKGRGVVEYEFSIFDRWGELLFRTNDFANGWDGSFKGKSCKSDVYQWRIKAGDGRGRIKGLAGHVTLYR
jgi:gliding motility-associated-like protein